MDDREAEGLVERVEALLEQVDGIADPSAQELAGNLVQALVELYGEGLARLMAAVPEPTAVAGDALVEHLLLLHDLHPVPLEDRVRRALADVSGVELVSIADGVVRLRGCNPAAEAAIQRAAPDVERIDDVDQPLLVLPQAGVG
jgi:hypothetical protein